MKRLLLSLSLGLSLTGTLPAMELPEASSQPKEQAIVTFIMPDGSTHEMLKKYVELSSTLKDMLAETDNQKTLPVPAPIAESFDLIKPYFKLGYMNAAQQMDREEEKIKALHGALAEHTDQELATIINAFNYLNMPAITDAASTIMAERMLEDGHTQRWLENDSYNLPTLDGDMAKTCAQKMLSKNPDLKAYWLLQEALKSDEGKTKIIPTGTYSISCINKQGTLAAATDRENIVLFDLQKERKLSEVRIPQGPHPGYVRGVCFSPDGSLLATGTDNGEVYLWNISNPHQITLSLPLQGDHDSSILTICFSPDGSLLSFQGRDTIYVYNLEKKELNTRAIPHMSFNGTIIRCICFNSKSSILAVAAVAYDNRFRGKVMIINLETDNTLDRSFDVPGCISALQFSKDDNYLISADYNRGPKQTTQYGIMRWDMKTPKYLNKHDRFNLDQAGGQFDVTNLSEDGSLVVFRTNDRKTMALYSTENGKKISADFKIKGDCLSNILFNSQSSMILCPIWQTTSFDDHAIHLLPIIKPENALQKWFEKNIKPEEVILLNKIRNLKASQSQMAPLDLKKLQPQLDKCRFPREARQLIGQESVWEKVKERWKNISSNPTHMAIGASTAGLAAYMTYKYINK